MAQLAAWSISWSSKGVAPTVGFDGEPFEPGSTRYAMRGKEMAKGFRTLVATKGFQVLLNGFMEMTSQKKGPHTFAQYVGTILV